MQVRASDGAGGEGPPGTAAPIWRPSSARRARARIVDFAREARAFGAPDAVAPDGSLDYRALHRWSVEEPGPFWAAVWTFCGVVGYAGPEQAEAAGSRAEAGGGRSATDESAPGATRWRPDARHVVSSAGAAARMEPPMDSGLRWFPGVRLNYAENLLRGADDRPAVVAWDEEGPTTRLTLGQLRGLVARFARALRDEGIRPGDRVAGFLPNVPETVVAMLGAASVGAVWTSCSPDFGTEAVVDRFGQTEPRLLVAGTSHRYGGRVHDTRARVAEIAERLPTLERVVLVRGPVAGAGQPGSARSTDGMEDLAAAGSGGPSGRIPGAVAWDDFLPTDATPDYRHLPFDHPLAILYSSGTTGLPKCIVHGAGGTLLQHLKEHALHVDLGPGDRIFYFTTCGWMMWNWLVTALASGATIVLYDGAPHTPPDVLWRMADRERVTVFGTSARYLDFLRTEGLRPGDAYDLSDLRTVLSTGSPLPTHAFDYVYDAISSEVHLASISGGTDLVSCFVLGVPTEPVVRGRIQAAGLGMAVEVWSPEGRRIFDEPGELVCTRPFPTMPLSFWNDAGGERYRAAYFDHFPGVWRHGDWAEQGPDGSFVIHGRSDATLNPGGVRIGTAEIYRHLEDFEEIVDAVAVGLRAGPGGEGDERIVLFVRLRSGRRLDDGLRDRIRERLRASASPRHAPHRIEQVDDVPRTVSGKRSEVAVREALHGREIPNLSALANPDALDGFRRFADDRGTHAEEARDPGAGGGADRDVAPTGESA